MSLFWIFLIYSFIGFLIEVCYARMTGESKRDRKCRLFLPICPVYGLGALGLLLLPEQIQANPFLLFPAAVLVCTGAELLAGLFYEKVFLVSFWDYSQIRWNVGGLVCLPFSLAWSGLALGLVYTVHPFVKICVSAIPETLSTPAWIVLGADCLISSIALKREKNTVVLQWYRQ